jgi:hypothetical protein
MNIRIMLPIREIITIKSGLLRKLHQVLPTLDCTGVNIAKNFHGHKFQFKPVC